jgi:superfamily II DNA or RNA helicase
MNNVIQFENLSVKLPPYEKIKWASNYSKLTDKVHKYGGIIGYPKSKKNVLKVSRIPEVIYRPAYLGTFLYLDVDLKRDPQVALLEHRGSITKKKMTPQKLKVLEKNLEWQSVIESTMPPIVQSSGGEIIPTAVDEDNIFREWGYYMGDLSDIQKFISEKKSAPKNANAQVRFSPYIFVMSSYISVPLDYHYYLAGCIYYKMTISDIRQELKTVFRLNESNRYHYENILSIIEAKLAERQGQQMAGNVEGEDYRPRVEKTNELFINRMDLPVIRRDLRPAKMVYGAEEDEGGEIFQISGEEVDKIMRESDYEYYPDISAPNFECKLTRKNEFYGLRQESIMGKTMKDLCPVTEFPKLKSQELVRNFMRPDTPYMGLLVYHGLGTGKTCLSIQVAETFKPLVRKLGKKILVIVSKSILENYLKELYNFSKEPLEKKHGLARGTLQCTGLTYAPPAGLDIEDKIKIRNSKIRQYYEIITYMGIKKIFYEIARFYVNTSKKFDYDAAQKVCENKNFIIKLRNIFNDRLIIIDEVHNMRESTNEDEKISSYILELILKNCSRIKLLLLTATPIYNQPSEILYILNLLRMNEGLAAVKDSGQFFDQKDFRTDKKEEFKKLWKGRVSYVRGENPVNFPQKIFPDESLTYKPRWEYSHTRKRSVSNILNKFYPIPLVCARMSNYQERIYMEDMLDADEQRELTAEPESNMESFHFKKKQISNIVYPTTHVSEIPKMHGSRGFQNCFMSDTKRGPFKPAPSAFVEGSVFFMDEAVLPNYSPKMAIIFEHIKKCPDQLIFVYSEYLEGAVIPFCIMLEYHGFSRYDDSALFSGAKKKSAPIRDRKYILLDGSIPSTKRSKWVSKFNEPDNRNGRNIQVIIGTKVMGEGIDLKNIRQIHIFNPWFNMSRMDQIIGRGVRHCSHLDFDDAAKRNVKIFVYSATLFDRVSKVAKYESTDEYIYRMAVGKDVLFQRIFKSLKEVAFDCNLNHLVNFFPQNDKDDSRECAYQKCSLECDPICSYVGSEIDFSTFEPSLTSEYMKLMEKRILDAMARPRRSFTLRELVLAVFNNDMSHSDLEMFKFKMKELIRDKKVIYTGYQYVAVPNKYYDYMKMGLEYILYSDQRLPDKRTMQIPQNLESVLEEKDTRAQPQTALMLRTLQDQINEYDIKAWLADIQKIMQTRNYRRVTNIDVANDADIYRFFMNSFPYQIISLYLKNACVNNLISQFENAFGHLLVRPEKYPDSVMFLDLSMSGSEKLMMYSVTENRFVRGVDKTYFVNTYSRKEKKVPFLSASKLSNIAPNNVNQIYGIIQYNERSGKFVFKIVDKTLDSKKKRVLKTMLIRGENCNTKSIASKKMILYSLVNSYKNIESDVKKTPDFYDELKSFDLCILIQYMLYKHQMKTRDKLFIFEERTY